MSDVVPAGSSQPDRKPELRIGNPEREQVIQLLQKALGEGRLEVAEYDERVTAVYTARTQSELDPLVADLPKDQQTTRPSYARSGGSGQPKAESGGEHKSGGKKVFDGALRFWLGVVLLNFVIWAIVSLTNLEWIYPWFIWTAIPAVMAFLGGRTFRR